MYHRLISALMIGSLLTSCAGEAPKRQGPVKSVVVSEAWPPLKAALSCVAQTGPIISLHRGRDKPSGTADNSLSGLNWVRDNGYVMAEIDVGRLKDGTHVLFHDGVWDEDSTGQGPIAAMSWPDAEKLLLKDYKGNITSDRVSRLSDILDWADAKMYFEIDFKSSADEASITQLIRNKGMADHVALIAYSRKQALRLHKYAPDMMIATSANAIGDIKAYEVSGLPKDKILTWLGTRNFNPKLAQQLNAINVPSAFGMMSPRYADAPDYTDATILVSDYAGEAKEKARTRGTDARRLSECKL